MPLVPMLTATFTLARDHWATEEHLRSVGIAHPILRDNIYADFSGERPGWDYAASPTVDDNNVIVSPGGRTNVVALDRLTDDSAPPIQANAQGRYPVPIPGQWTEI